MFVDSKRTLGAKLKYSDCEKIYLEYKKSTTKSDHLKKSYLLILLLIIIDIHPNIIIIIYVIYVDLNITNDNQHIYIDIDNLDIKHDHLNIIYDELFNKMNI